ncbi:MAG TPA: nucleotide exchange factor GrpE [Ktedonobacterales bacterium]|nr:nucleotide exchange factor GrpE [Ktedonobacterales bacterium]
MSQDEHTTAKADIQTEPSEDIQADALPTTQADVTAQPNTADDSAATPAGSADDASARIAELERQLATERDAATDYMQKWQRAVADFANFKRRAQQEQEQRDQMFAAQALAPVLHALDSFERAFATLPDSLRGYTWIEGVALVDYQLRRALVEQGITEVAAEPGEALDPTRHQAVGEIETDQQPEGHIAVVLQKGYQTGNLLIRPALVQVARTPTAPETATASEQGKTEKADGESSAPATPEATEETQPSGPAP